MTDSAPVPGTVNPEHDLRGVLRVPAFRKLWTALSLSSFGDWLGLLALTALAPRLADDGYAAANVAIAGVFILRLAPAIVIGPLAGVVADRLDRRWTMVVCDLIRFALFLSIPLVGTLWWLLVATFLIEAASLVWIPAKEATMPNLVPRERLETANQLSLFTTYGSAPVAAAVFSGLALLSGIVDNAVPQVDEVDLALFFNAATFLVSALTILRLTEIPPRAATVRPDGGSPTIWRTLLEGWTFIGRTRLVRGLVAGMLGAFAAGGAVIGLARTFVGDLGAGEPGYGLLFGTVFVGLAGGMFVGPRLVPEFSRRRLLGFSIAAAGCSLALLALIPHMVAAVLITLIIGIWAGIAWVTGYTLLGLEVADELRGRTFAFVQTLVRATLVLVLAVAPLLAAAFGQHRIRVTDAMVLTYNGAAITMLLFGLLAAVLGVASFRHMDDRRGIPVFADLRAAYRHAPVGPPRESRRVEAGGFFLALEGGEGVGKSTQARMLADWLRAKGHDVVVTFEPGGTAVGQRLRRELLDVVAEGGAGLSARTEALLFAADRAEHVAMVIQPALDRGAVVVSDRYADSSIAYQGAGRDLETADVARISRWATDGLRPDLTVLLDLPPELALARVDVPDRLESEPLEFHERVRQHFLTLARSEPTTYLVVDAALAPEQMAAQVQARLLPILPLSARERAEQEAAEQQRRAEEEERRRLEAAAAAEAEELARRQADALAKRKAAEAAAQAQRTAEERGRRDAEARARKEEKRLAAEARKQAAEAESQARRRAAEAEAEARRRAAAEAERRHADAAETQRLNVPGTYAAPSHEERADPPTRPLSLADELLGGGSPADDETIQLPVHKSRDDR